MDAGSETGLLHWLFTAAVGAGGAFVMWLLNRSVNQMDDAIKGHDQKLEAHGRQHADCSLELANFKTEVAKEYAKEATIQQSLSRIHERMDEGNRDTQAHFKELRDDIKQILQKVK